MTNTFFANPHLLMTNIYGCTYAPQDYSECFASSNYEIAAPVFAGVGLVLALFKLSITNVSLFATVGTPAADDPYEFYVYIAPYNWDRVIDTTFMVLEMITIIPTFIYIGYDMLDFWYNGNVDSYGNVPTSFSNYYLTAILGLAMWAAVPVDSAGLLLKAFYNLVSVSYVTVTKQYNQVREIERVQFYPFWQLMIHGTGEGQDLWLSLLIYVVQITGHKPVTILMNIVTGLALCAHPYTLPFAVYFFAQLPLDALLEYGIFPIFPQFEAPFVHKAMMLSWFGVEDKE